MAWCHRQPTNPYRGQFWPSSLSPYVVTRHTELRFLILYSVKPLAANIKIRGQPWNYKSSLFMYSQVQWFNVNQSWSTKSSHPSNMPHCMLGTNLASHSITPAESSVRGRGWKWWEKGSSFMIFKAISEPLIMLSFFIDYLCGLPMECAFLSS